MYSTIIATQSATNYSVGFDGSNTSLNGTNSIILAISGSPVLTINSSGGLGLGSGSSFGTSGQVLTSQGTGAAPIWTTVSSSGGVTSFNGRTGSVVPATNDYAFNQINGSLGTTQLPAFTGDVTSPAGSSVTTLATVNSNIGTFTNATVTVNAKGLITAASAGSSTGGTVTSVAVRYSGPSPSVLTVTGSPITSSGTITFGLGTQSPNTVFAGPSVGATGTPGFRSLVAADIPTNGIEKVIWRYGPAPSVSTWSSSTPYSTTSGVAVSNVNTATCTATYTFTGYDHPPVGITTYAQQTASNVWNILTSPFEQPVLSDTGTAASPNLITGFTSANTLTWTSAGSDTNASDGASTGAYLIIIFKF